MRTDRRGGRNAALLVALAALAPLAATAYPGGTPSYQVDAAPYCAACHSSRAESALAGAGARATKELVANKHYALIEAGEQGYGELSPADRATLLSQIQALDEASTVSLEAPDRVPAGSTFRVTVQVTGGGGPVAGVALVDADHRWYARPITAQGFVVTEPPAITGRDGERQTEWLERRPEARDRNLSFVNILEMRSDATTRSWARGQVAFTLRAPAAPGRYPLSAAFLYGTEFSTPLGFVRNALGQPQPRGTYTGGSGRVLFAPVHTVAVE